MKVADALSAASSRLDAAGVADPRREAASLLALALDKPNTFLIAHPEYELIGDEKGRFNEFVARRATREPFQYIAGRQEFYGLEFEVTPDVLIPRPETEILVEEAIKGLGKLAELDKLSKLSFCEIGVGSGCISVSILRNVPNATAVATDISDKALAAARRNAERHGVADRLVLKLGDLFAGVVDKFDMIVSNPPYIPDADLTDMQPEVRDFEPHNALFAGNDGLDIVRRIIEEAPEHLNSGGLLLMEIGVGQSELLRRHFDTSIWKEPGFLADLQCIPRIAKALLR
jgi:release factor glutamine methyltransferase